MKKIMFLLAFVGLSAEVSAQDDEIPVKKQVITNSFWSNWYVSAGGEFNASYSSQERLGNRNPFSVDRGTFGFNAAIGKWVTPVIGFRTQFQGIWAKQVMDASHHPSYRYWNLHEDVTVNLSNLFWGYKEDRVWNLVPYAGVGLARNMSANRYATSFNAGLLNNFRLSRHVSLFVDLAYHSMGGAFDHAPFDKWDSYNRFAMRHVDKMLTFSVGITYHIGKSKWQKAPDIEALMEMNREQVEAMNSSMEDQQRENERLRQMLADQHEGKAEPTATTEVRMVSTAHSVFFDLGSAKVASRKDLIDLKDLADYATRNKLQLVVAGYADSKTGSAERNQQLSEERARTVAEELVKMGVPRDAILVEAKGGVDEIAPFSYNRRVIVRLK